MTKSKLLILAVITFTLASCLDKEKELDLNTIQISAHQKFESINDSTFFGLLSSIHEKNGLTYLSDLKNGNVTVLDKNYNVVNVLGSKGQGPGQLIGPRNAYTKKNRTYVLDDGSSKINVYESGGEFLGAFKGLLPSVNDFIVTSDSLIIGSQLEFGLQTPPLFQYDLRDTSTIVRFGKHNRVLPEFNIGKPRDYFVKEINAGYLAICKNDPVIELYDKSLKKISEFSFQDYQYLQSYIPKKRERQLKEKIGIDNFVIDCDVHDNNIYLLLAGYNDKLEKGESRHILQLVVTDNNAIKPVKAYSLSENTDCWYYSFSVSGNELIGFDAVTYELHSFRLSQ